MDVCEEFVKNVCEKECIVAQDKVGLFNEKQKKCHEYKKYLENELCEEECCSYRRSKCYWLKGVWGMEQEGMM